MLAGIVTDLEFVISIVWLNGLSCGVYYMVHLLFRLHRIQLSCFMSCNRCTLHWWREAGPLGTVDQARLQPSP